MRLVRYREHGLHSRNVVGLMRHVGTRARRIEIVLIDAAGLRLRRLPVSESRYMTFFNYAPKKAVRRFRRMAKLFGATKGAKRFLSEAK